MGDTECVRTVCVCALQMASGRPGPWEEEPNWASSQTKCLKFHSINAVGQIKGMITQAAGHSLKYTTDNNGSVTIYIPTAVSPPIYS